jgi:hypothetical protein
VREVRRLSSVPVERWGWYTVRSLGFARDFGAWLTRRANASTSTAGSSLREDHSSFSMTTGKVEEDGEAKKIGADNGDPSHHSQPRLPGSVVGEASIGQSGGSDKITEVTVPELRTLTEPH